MRSTKRYSVFLAVTIAVAAASCGGDDDGATAETTATTSPHTTTIADTTASRRPREPTRCPTLDFPRGSTAHRS